MNKQLNFGQAIEALKDGKMVARYGWNGKGMWLQLEKGKILATQVELTEEEQEATMQDNDSIVHDIDGVPVRLFTASETVDCNVIPFIRMKTDTTGIKSLFLLRFVTWVSKNFKWRPWTKEMLAEDWVIVE